MKEVAIREYKGGYSGFSFPVGKTGIRYKVGGSRGHSVQVGTKLDVADTGTAGDHEQASGLHGDRKTVDMPYAKLDNLTVFYRRRAVPSLEPGERAAVHDEDR